MVSVDHSGGFAVADHLKLRDGPLDPVLDDTVIVDGLKPPDTVRIDAALVGGNEDFCADPGIGVGDSDCLENVNDESLQQITGYPGMGCRHLLLLPRVRH
jgi:hypothetical protein